MRLTEFSLLALSSLFAMLDPIAVVPAFIAMTPNDSPAAKLRTARLACSVAAGVLIVFAATGNMIFKVMGITLPAFQLAGSILLLRIALDMLYARRSGGARNAGGGGRRDGQGGRRHLAPGRADAGRPGHDFHRVDPAAPGQGPVQMAALFGAIVLVCLSAYVIFWLVVHGAHHLNPLALKLVTRLFGLLLAAVAVQFILNALEQSRFCDSSALQCRCFGDNNGMKSGCWYISGCSTPTNGRFRYRSA